MNSSNIPVHGFTFYELLPTGLLIAVLLIIVICIIAIIGSFIYARKCYILLKQKQDTNESNRKSK